MTGILEQLSMNMHPQIDLKEKIVSIIIFNVHSGLSKFVLHEGMWIGNELYRLNL